MRTNCKQVGSAGLHRFHLKGTDHSYNPELFFQFNQHVLSFIDYCLLNDPLDAINCLCYWQRHWIQCVIIKWTPVNIHQLFFPPKEHHEVITNPMGEDLYCTHAKVQVVMVTETFHRKWISWLSFPQKHVNNTTRSMQSIFHCQIRVNAYHQGNAAFCTAAVADFLFWMYSGKTPIYILLILP